ncbi:hypothetical protein FGG08_001137 [Glutinoglossum americanum]|uniref:Uncharacterized protein n=1 Tax=Glutinoglossum americanum TaxID=1670608 RepID=A0A9P8L5J9_9PEZI|nr:hypothetical protein FGG08_001137 [Glutinoglossum americanum]
MRLERPLPESLRSELQVGSELLRSMISEFRPLAADLKVWTFYETEDTDLSIPSTSLEDVRLLAPIASIKSTILDLYNEVDYPLPTDHVGCASFSGKTTQTKEDYLHQLKEATELALRLSGVKHSELELREKVKVDIHGFYMRGAGEPIRLWSAHRTLQEFRQLGPSMCLEERLKDIPGDPRPNQMRRATSLDNRAPGNGAATTPNQAARSATPKLTGDASGPKPPFGDASARRRSLSRIRNLMPSPGFSSQKNTMQPQAEIATSAIPRETVPSVIVHQSSDGPNDGTQEPAAPQEPLPGRKSTDSSIKSASSGGIREPGSAAQAVSEPDSGSKLTPVGLGQGTGARTQLLRLPGSEALKPIGGSGRRASEQGRTTGGFGAPQVPQFVKPEATNRILTWIHVPFNNPAWVLDVLERIAIDDPKDSYEKLLDLQNWTSKYVRRRHSEHHTCFLKPSCSFVSSEQRATPPGTPSAGGPASPQISLCLPYLHWDTYKLLVKRRNLVKYRMSHGRSRPVPENVCRMELEHRVTWAFLGHDPPFNCRRTLDQFGYPNLHDTRARDDDQMLYKMTKQRWKKLFRDASNIPKPSAERGGDVSDDEQQDTDEEKVDGEEESIDGLLDGTVLMVDQLWLWVVSDKTTATFFPRRQSKPIEGRLHQQADLRNSIYNEVNGDLGCRCENSLDLAALVALHAVTVLFERSSHDDLEVFRIFEESISILIEKMTRSFKDFRLQGFRDKRVDYDSDNHKVGIKEKHKREGEMSEKQNRDDTSAMLELRDIDDELNTLKRLFKQQTETITRMQDIYRDKDKVKPELSANGLPILKNALEKLEEYTDQVDQMLETANRTRKDVHRPPKSLDVRETETDDPQFEKLLYLKQRQANVDEARLARYHADLASMQSRAVMIFTVFSVIFVSRGTQLGEKSAEQES